jgi:cytochrome c553
MKRVLKYFAYFVCLVIAVAAAAVAYVFYASNQRVAQTYAVTPPPLQVALGDPAAIERGRYLVHKVSLCIECHGEDLGGKEVMDSAVMATLWGSNLTGGRGGLGSIYSDADLVRVMTHGVKKDGHSVIFMPSQDYTFTAADMGALIAYLRSVPPVDRDVPAPVLGPMARILGLAGKFPLLSAELIDHDAVAFVAEADRSEAAKAGDYLISTAGCRGCHGPQLSGEGGMPDAANLTPVGIGAWTEADFKTAIREGRRPNGTLLLPAMPRAYQVMPDEELSKIFAYLKTLPAAGTKSKNQAL